MSELADRLKAVLMAEGVLATALDDLLPLGERHFALPPSDAEVAQWVADMKASRKTYFAPTSLTPPDPAEQERQRILSQLSPQEKLNRARLQGRSTPVERKGTTRAATAAEIAAQEQLQAGSIDKLTKARAITSRPAPQQGG